MSTAWAESLSSTPYPGLPHFPKTPHLSACPVSPACLPVLLTALSVTPSSDPTEPPVRVVAPEAAQTRVRSTPGGDLELVVHFSRPGGPVRWYKDGERLADQGRVQLEQAGARQVLRVRGARRGDAGEYLCDVPQDSRIFIVSVEGNSAPLTRVGFWHPQRPPPVLLGSSHLHLTQLAVCGPHQCEHDLTLREQTPFSRTLACCMAQ